MKRPFKIGFCFGLTSGIVTTLGLMVGLHSSTQSTHAKLIIIGGILTIALADSFSEALGIHISQKAENIASKKEIWEATTYTLISKFIFSSIFIIPVLLLRLNTAIIISIMIGMYLIMILSIAIARERGEKPWKVVTEHVGICFIVIILTHYVGQWIHLTFG